MSHPSSPNIYGPSSASFIPLTNEDYAKFSRIFKNCNPKDGELDGEAARDLLMKSKLPIEILGQIWNLADTRNRGRLDQAEFVVAMYFVQHFMNGNIKSIPSHLPPELLKAAKRGQTGSPTVESAGVRSRSSTFTGVTPSPGISRAASTSLRSGYSSVKLPNTDRVDVNVRSMSLNSSPFAPQNTLDEEWAIKPEDKAKFDRFFSTIDTSQKGYITGEEAVQYFLRSKLPEAVLAQIWDLADISQNGQLNREEFAVSMYLIQLKLSGGELPQVLPRSLVPPSMRKPLASGNFTPNPSGNSSLSQMPAQTTSLLDFNDDNLELIKSPPMQSKPLKGSDTAKSVGSLPSTPPLDTSEILNLQNQIAHTTSATNESRQQRAQLENNLASITAQKNELTAKYSEIKAQYDAELQAIQGLQDALKKESDDLENTRKELTTVEEELKQLQAQKNELEEALEKNKKECTEIEQEVEQLQSQKSELEEALEKDKKESNEIEEMVQQLLVQKSELEEALKKDKEESNNINQKVDQLNEELQMLKIENENLDKEIEQQKSLLQTGREQLANISDERQRLGKEVDERKEELTHVNEDLENSKLNLSAEPNAELSPAGVSTTEEAALDNEKSIVEPDFKNSQDNLKSTDLNVSAGPISSDSVSRNLSASSFDEAFPPVNLDNIEENPFTSGFDDSFSTPNVLPGSISESQPPEPVVYGNPIFWESTESANKNQSVNSISTEGETCLEQEKVPSTTLQHTPVHPEEPIVPSNYTEEPESEPEQKHEPELKQEYPLELDKEKSIPASPKNEVTLLEASADDKKAEPLSKEPESVQGETSAVHFNEQMSHDKMADDFDTIFDDDFVDLKAKRASGLNGGLTEFDTAFDTDFDVNFDTSFDTSKAKSPFDDFEFNTEFPSSKQPTEEPVNSSAVKPSSSNANQDTATSPFTGFGFDNFHGGDNNLTNTNDLDEAFGGKVDLNKVNNNIGFDDVFGDAFAPPTSTNNQSSAAITNANVTSGFDNNAMFSSTNQSNPVPPLDHFNGAAPVYSNDIPNFAPNPSPAPHFDPFGDTTPTHPTEAFNTDPIPQTDPFRDTMATHSNEPAKPSSAPHSDHASHSKEQSKSKHKSPVFSFKPFKKKSKPVAITEDDLYSSNLEELMGMGFTQEQSVDALERYDNDLNKASNFLLDQ